MGDLPGLLIPIIGCWVSYFVLEYYPNRKEFLNGGGNYMIPIIVALITLTGSVIFYIFQFLKCRQMEKAEHDRLNREHQSLTGEHSKHSIEHQKLSNEHQRIQDNQKSVAKEVTEVLRDDHSKLQSTVNDVRDWVLKEEAAKTEAAKNGVDLVGVISQIQSLAEDNKKARDQVLETDLAVRKLEVELREKDQRISKLLDRIEELQFEISQLKNSPEKRQEDSGNRKGLDRLDSF